MEQGEHLVVVRVYWNRHVRQYSIMDYSRGPNHRRVFRRSSLVFLRDVEMVVTASGQERWRKTGERNVHAFLQGELITINDAVIGPQWMSLSYTPERGVFFDIKTQEPVHRASMAMLCLVSDGLVPRPEIHALPIIDETGRGDNSETPQQP